MQNKKKKKKALLATIKESMTKTGGCCGPGETCGGSVEENNKETAEDTKLSDKTNKK